MKRAAIAALGAALIAGCGGHSYPHPWCARAEHLISTGDQLDVQAWDALSSQFPHSRLIITISDQVYTAVTARDAVSNGSISDLHAALKREDKALHAAVAGMRAANRACGVPVNTGMES